MDKQPEEPTNITPLRNRSGQHSLDDLHEALAREHAANPPRHEQAYNVGLFYLTLSNMGIPDDFVRTLTFTLLSKSQKGYVKNYLEAEKARRKREREKDIMKEYGSDNGE